MKSYREIADSVFARREQYVIAQRKKKQLVTRVTASVGSVALVSLASFALFKSDAFRETPPISDGGATTTTTHIPTEGEDTTTTTTVNTTTDGGIVTPPTTVTTVAPTQTTAKPTTGKTEPPKTTTTTVKKKVVITADEPEDFSSDNPHAPLKKQEPISPALQEKMEQYKGSDVVYSVIVEVLMTDEEIEVSNQLPNTNDELIQLLNEQRVAYNAYIQAKEQAGGKYTPEVVEKYDVFRNLSSQYLRRCDILKSEYHDQCRNQRLKELSDLNKGSLISITTDTRYCAIYSNDPNYVFFMELTAAEINDLAERGGYFIRLVFPGGDKIEEDKPM